MSEKTKNILTTIAISIVSLILVLIIGFLAYFNRWRFMKSVPESKYEEYIIGKWKRYDGLIVEYTKDGKVNYYNSDNVIISIFSEEKWMIENKYLYRNKTDNIPLYGGSRVLVINENNLVLNLDYIDNSEYRYYLRLK